MIRQRHLSQGLLIAGVLALNVCLVGRPLWGDGFHNAALVTNSLDQWVSQLSQKVPEVGQALSGGELRAGESLQELKKKAQGQAATGAQGGKGKLQTQLTAQQQAMLAELAANDCLEILAYMDPKNILPNEFPNFPLERCGEFRSTAKRLIRLMGAQGTSAVAQQLRAELLGNGKPSIPGDLTTVDSYRKDLLDLLSQGVEAGELSEADQSALEEAVRAAGKGPQSELAKEVGEILEAGPFGQKSVKELVELYSQRGQSPRTKQAILNAIHKKLAESSVAELEEILESKADLRVRVDVQKELERRVSEGTELDLVELLETSKSKTLRTTAETALKDRKPKFAQLEPQIRGLAKLLDARNLQAAQAARAQLERAFRIAPLSRCLAWLGKEGPKLDEVIYAQLDYKVDRAQPDRRQEYLQTCLAVVEDSKAPEAAQRGALRVLARLGERAAVKPLVDALPKLSRRLWPEVGKALQQLTGKDYGPKQGDGLAELNEARKKWQQWLRLQQEK